MNRTILLVEDDVNDVFFMKRAMKMTGMLNPVQVAADGREAIHYLAGTGEYGDRERYPLPGLIFLDLKLPHVMGLDVLKWIREQPELRAVIVIVFTSSKMPFDIRRAYLLGANSYVVKPSDPTRLVDSLSLVNQYWLQLNEAPAPDLALWAAPPAKAKTARAVLT